MPGIVFFAAEDEERVGEFYRDEAGAEVWLEQDGCTILEHGGLNFGFCERDRTEDPDGRAREFQTFLHPLPAEEDR